MHPAVRISAVALLAAVTITCAEQTVSGVRLGRLAQFAITPVFDQAPEGGPNIDVERIRGVLKKVNGTDSVVAEALVQGDSAILEFTNVTVTGDSTSYELGLQAFDHNDTLVFVGSQEMKVTPGENAPAAPPLAYAAPDKNVDAIDIKAGSGSGPSATLVQLDWLGAVAGSVACLNRAPKAQPTTQENLVVVGTAAGQVVNNVHVGWTSRDVNVATVDETGLVSARCSNKATYIVARTFLNVVDSVQVNVTAPPFSLLMSPDSTSLERGATKQLTALVVDENNNVVPAASPTWSSSDVTRATVNASGLVQAIRNGRVFITASFSNRTTVGVVQVVRPKAASVQVIPHSDTVAFGQTRQFFARAFDAAGRVIGDATEFAWSASNSSAATISTTGFATAKQVPDTTVIQATIDGKTGSAALRVVSSLPPGTIVSTVKDGSADAPLSGATISTSVSCTATSAADGSFSLPCVQAGDNISFTKPGYVDVTFYDAPAFPGRTIQVPAIPLSPTAAQGATGTMSGKVVNALTGNVVSGMTIKAYAGLHANPTPKRPDVTPVATGSSNADGIFSIVAPPGAYTLVASGTGYSDAFGVGISVSGVTKFTPSIIAPPVIPGGGLYVVLTWGDCTQPNVPCDLDAHLTGPKSSTDPTRIQVFSGNRAYVDVDTIAALDVEKSASPGRGPEVLSLRPSATPGLYRFYVHDVSNSTNSTSFALSNFSAARVDVFQDNRVIATFFPPPNAAGTLWEVFSYDGARIFPVGQITYTTTPATLP